MTIAMMIEMMAGKSAAVHGLVHDATPFRFNEKQTAIDYFGKLLEFGKLLMQFLLLINREYFQRGTITMEQKPCTRE